MVAKAKIAKFCIIGNILFWVVEYCFKTVGLCSFVELRKNSGCFGSPCTVDVNHSVTNNNCNNNDVGDDDDDDCQQSAPLVVVDDEMSIIKILRLFH